MFEYFKNLTISIIIVLFFVQGTSFAMDEIEWSYSGSTGPEHWGEISDDYTACFTGGLQSPIDITDAKQSNLNPITFYYYKSPRMGLTNTGHTVEVDFGEGSDIKLGKTEYNLKQIHFHTPSEHTVNGEQSPMEIHFVHQSSSHRIAVIGILVTAGEENKFFKPMIKKAPKNKGGFNIVYHKNLTPKNLIPEKKEYYKYTGSLTTPPCTEGVSWFILKENITMSEEQINNIKELVGTNNRPIQPRNNRNIRETMEKVPEPVAPPVEETATEDAIETEEGEETPTEEATEVGEGEGTLTEEATEVEAMEETPTEDAIEVEAIEETATEEPTEAESATETPVEEEIEEEPESNSEEEVEDEIVEEIEIEVTDEIVEDIEIDSEEDIEIEELD